MGTSSILTEDGTPTGLTCKSMWDGKVLWWRLRRLCVTVDRLRLVWRGVGWRRRGVCETL